jgi:hypothetical protein
MNYLEWIENDYNPFIMFSNSGSVIYANGVAELFLSYVNKQEIFNIATTYAKKDFGFKTTFIKLEFGKFSFYAIMVGYKNDEQIGIKLYQNPKINNKKEDYQLPTQKTNIYVVIDLCISLIAINDGIKFENILDSTLPDFYIAQNEFIKLLRKIYEIFIKSNTIYTILKINIGEFILLNNSKYQLLNLSIKGDSMQKFNKNSLLNIAQKLKINLLFKSNKITLEIPLVV